MQQDLVIEKIIKELSLSKKNKQEIKNIINDLENKKIDRLKNTRVPPTRISISSLVLTYSCTIFLMFINYQTFL